MLFAAEYEPAWVSTLAAKRGIVSKTGCTVDYYKNYRANVVLVWNMSKLQISIFSLAVGVLLMQFCQYTVAADPNIYLAQKRLFYKGYDPGPVDGMMGDKTRRAIANFQWDAGLSITNRLDKRTRESLGLIVAMNVPIGAASLKLLDVPILDYDRYALVDRLKKMNIRYDGSRHLTLFELEGYVVHTGHIMALIQAECVRPFEVSIGEMSVAGQNLRASDFGDIFPGAVEKQLSVFHGENLKSGLQSARNEAVLVCTAGRY